MEIFELENVYMLPTWKKVTTLMLISTRAIYLFTIQFQGFYLPVKRCLASVFNPVVNNDIVTAID